ncbi:uncharacterized protein LOC133286276 isoform X2 [Gastrolobium bilobum]|uniref:uncharacterized protein LOC133286276 isoform X2 n=1 Tax=Gastrolobium bilobum TaxID=150636 RepID=UPI002AB01199|nr:uncharacterized protein LOC133286276 isoform X2 [Gastrolobium bilobum]
MEVLYSKLYDKYIKLKTKKLSELDQLNKEQEDKFMNYLSEELIEHLKSENDQLHEKVNDLISEVASVRLAKDKQVAEYQRLLMEESKKNEALSEEVEKLQKLQQEGTSGDLNNNSKVIAEDDQFKAISNSSSRRMMRKRSRKDALEEEARFISRENVEGNSLERESTQNFCKEPLECCTRTNDQSGVDLQESGNCYWLIQALFEYALGMKLSTDYQTGRICLSALHQSSGYSFNLTWISKAPGEEAELLYHVLSLGTFERVAPEWMREDIMFSPTMCPIFFERVSHVIKLNH